MLTGLTKEQKEASKVSRSQLAKSLLPSQFLFRAVAAGDVAGRQNKEVSDPTVALCHGLHLQQTLPPVYSCLKRTILFYVLCSEPTIDSRYKSYQVPGNILFRYDIQTKQMLLLCL